MHHLTQRGNYRQTIFQDDTDHIVYLKFFNEYSQKYGVEVYAYCLMRNHVHFIVKPLKENSLARTVNVAHQRYAYYYHQKNGEQGHLWQSRYYSCVLQGRHFHEAVRYVERNPVRAHIVRYPWEYKWSSVRTRLGQECKIIQLADISQYLDLNSWKDYLMGEASNEELNGLRETTRQGLVFGEKAFIENLGNEMKRDIFLRSRGRPRRG